MTGSKDLAPLHWAPFKMMLNNQFRYKPQYPPKETSLSGKTAIVTGANTGLGFDSARQLLALKLSHLIIAVRSTSKGETAAADLRQRYPKAKIEVWQLDMSLYDSVQSFARRVQQQVQRIDITILNAGLSNVQFRTCPSTGHEETIQVNYISTVLLATLLLPIMKEKKPPTGHPGILTIVNSGLALTANFKNRNAAPLLPSFDEQKTFHMTDTYATSKTLGHLWLYHACEYVSADDVVLSMVDPGYVKGTGLQRDLPVFMKPVLFLFDLIAGKTVEVGGASYVDAVVNKGKESHGCFVMCFEIRP